MTEETARWLPTDAGQSLLRAATDLWEERADVTHALDALRKLAPPVLAAAAWEMAVLRARARTKFGVDAARMYFTREALEQASGARTASYHARRFSDAGIRTLADVCGGIGGDTLAFARAGLRVTFYERDPVRALLAEANVRALALEGHVSVIAADVTMEDVRAEALWFDPARRAERGRVGDPEDYQPPLSLLHRWQGLSVGVKLAPAIEHAVASDFDAGLEFISDSGECKEALLWTGALRQSLGIRALLLTDAGDHAFESDPGASIPIADGREGQVLYEPDAAVIRAHGVASLGKHLRAKLVAPQIAYLIGDEYVQTPFATAYDVLERLTYSRRRLQEALTRRQVGHVVIKKRGFPTEPDTLRRELRLRGPDSVTIVLTRDVVGSGHQALLCRPCRGR